MTDLRPLRLSFHGAPARNALHTPLHDRTSPPRIVQGLAYGVVASSMIWGVIAMAITRLV